MRSAIVLAALLLSGIEFSGTPKVIFWIFFGMDVYDFVFRRANIATLFLRDDTIATKSSNDKDANS